MPVLQGNTDQLSLKHHSWSIKQIGTDKVFNFNVPGDIHSALLTAQCISDPYWRDTETSLDWIHESEWLAQTQFNFNPEKGINYTLSFAVIDCHAIVLLNGIELGVAQSQFIRWDFDVSDCLISGDNILQVLFKSNSAVAAEKAAASVFPIPFIAQNNRLAHYNFLRKTQCHAGWDWNIALSPLGLYGDIIVKRTEQFRFDDFLLRQCHELGFVRLEVALHCDVFEPCEIDAVLRLGSQNVSKRCQLYPGMKKIELSLVIDDPILWWPVGEGEQHLYPLTLSLGSQNKQSNVGLRSIYLDTATDEIGNKFAFHINNRPLFMRGANWIPADALPQRASEAVVKDLLQSAVDANMNMIRIWGGGQYEADWFYALCDELGLLVWQDFMFACNAYPAHQRQWLDLVRKEATQQIRRLSSHPCLALWCGDNELVGALGWFEETTADRDRYLAIYDRLNHALEEIFEDEAPDVQFWPSSPSVGRLNFSDGWHIDTSGDMHFWDVWHSAKDFEHYRTVKPRFCSEFGFQSFPSMPVINSFTQPEDHNISSSVMEIHQRNPGGNARIVETLQRYFRFPETFADMVYLSQVSQGLAMKTSIEYWRSNKPRCMGTLYWQLNDSWPVASWSSLEYGGGWKCTHYLAKRYYAPLLITTVPDNNSATLGIFAINDTPAAIQLQIELQAVSSSGQLRSLGSICAICPTDCAIQVHVLSQSALMEDEFLHYQWHDTDNRYVGENEYLPKRPKEYSFDPPNIRTQIDGDTVTLTSDKLALYVTYDHGGCSVYSDNCFTLLPGIAKTLKVLRQRTSTLSCDNNSSLKTVHYLKG